VVEETQQLSEVLFGGRGAHFADVLRICFLPCVAALRERPYQSTAVLVPCRPIRGAWQPATLSRDVPMDVGETPCADVSVKYMYIEIIIIDWRGTGGKLFFFRCEIQTTFFLLFFRNRWTRGQTVAKKNG